MAGGLEKLGIGWIGRIFFSIIFCKWSIGSSLAFIDILSAKNTEISKGFGKNSKVHYYWLYTFINFANLKIQKFLKITKVLQITMDF
jgi:hypothetical protein